MTAMKLLLMLLGCVLQCLNNTHAVAFYGHRLVARDNDLLFDVKPNMDLDSYTSMEADLLPMLHLDFSDEEPPVYKLPAVPSDKPSIFKTMINMVVHSNYPLAQFQHDSEPLVEESVVNYPLFIMGQGSKYSERMSQRQRPPHFGMMSQKENEEQEDFLNYQPEVFRPWISEAPTTGSNYQDGANAPLNSLPQFQPYFQPQIQSYFPIWKPSPLPRTHGWNPFSTPNVWNPLPKPHSWNPFPKPHSWNPFSKPHSWNPLPKPHSWNPFPKPDVWNPSPLPKPHVWNPLPLPKPHVWNPLPLPKPSVWNPLPLPKPHIWKPFPTPDVWNSIKEPDFSIQTNSSNGEGSLTGIGDITGSIDESDGGIHVQGILVGSGHISGGTAVKNPSFTKGISGSINESNDTVNSEAGHDGAGGISGDNAIPVGPSTDNVNPTESNDTDIMKPYRIIEPADIGWNPFPTPNVGGTNIWDYPQPADMEKIFGKNFWNH